MVSTQPVIVVDPISTGAVLARFLSDLGYPVVRVFSDMCPPSVRALVKAGCEVDWLATIQHETNSLASTVGQLQKLGPCEVLVGCETGVNLTDELTHALGVRGNGVKQLKERRNKFLQAECVRAAGLDAPRQMLASTMAHVDAFLQSFKAEEGVLPFKAVAKPVEGAGSDGVTICNAPDEVRAAFRGFEGTKNVLGLQNYEVLLQEFLHGIEYVVDSVSRDGEHKIVAIWRYDKRDYHGSPVVYHGMKLLNVESNPTLHTKLVSYARAVLDALGIRNGAMHSEVMATPRGPVLVEVNCRLHGGEGIWLPIAQECFGYTQVSAMYDAYFDPAAFAKLPLTPPSAMLKHGAWVTIRSPRAGLITEVKTAWLEHIRKLPSYVDEYIAPIVAVGCDVTQTVDATTVHGCFNLAHASEEILRSDYDTAQLLVNEGLFVVEPRAQTLPLFGAPATAGERCTSPLLLEADGQQLERPTRRAVKDLFGAEHVARSQEASKQASKHASKQASKQASPKTSPKTSPGVSRKDSPGCSLATSPELTATPTLRLGGMSLSKPPSLVLDPTEKISIAVKIS